MERIDFKIRNKMDILMNQGGYVMDFSNVTFSSFVLESVEEDIYMMKNIQVTGHQKVSG